MADLVEFLELHVLFILLGASIYILVIYITYDPTRGPMFSLMWTHHHSDVVWMPPQSQIPGYLSQNLDLNTLPAPLRGVPLEHICISCFGKRLLSCNWSALSSPSRNLLPLPGPVKSRLGQWLISPGGTRSSVVAQYLHPNMWTDCPGTEGPNQPDAGGKKALCICPKFVDRPIEKQF
jgi:hypothetical protein